MYISDIFPIGYDSLQSNGGFVCRVVVRVVVFVVGLVVLSKLKKTELRKVSIFCTFALGRTLNLLLGGDYYHSQSSPNSGQERGDDGRISFEFDVTFGMEFYLFGRGSIMAFNGGFLDSSHTLTSSLTVSGATEEESEAIISNNLTLIKTVSVPAPSTLAIFLLGALGLAFRRFKK